MHFKLLLNGMLRDLDDMRMLAAPQPTVTVWYSHDRDLKLDNTLLDGSRPPRVKLCDFGFAKDFEPGQNLLTNIGCDFAIRSPTLRWPRTVSDMARIFNTCFCCKTHVSAEAVAEAHCRGRLR